jgi:lipopolysaccharide biosynthesis regulator YciM
MTKMVVKDEKGRWTWEKKVETATKYNQLGNMRLVSELTEVPYDTLLEWKQSEWWPQIMDEIKRAKQQKTNNKLVEIVTHSLELVEDRLKNGNMHWDSDTKEVVRVPISLKDAAKVANDLLDKQIKMEEMISRVDIQKESVQDTLKLLATEFSKWAGKKNQDVIDVQFKEIPNVPSDGNEANIQASLVEASGVESGSDHTEPI